MNLTQVARLVTQLSSKHRTPSIKFLGPRTPKPKYDANKYPMKIQSTSSSSSSSTSVSSAPPKISSIGKIGTTARGTGIDESQLPLRFRRRPIDEEEIAIINVSILKVVFRKKKTITTLIVHAGDCCS
uniref:Uncharacterized protein n=1 Tax=Panagrolaimus davidi TaxID=227884 RepID=A0A914PU32_9BILA